MVWLTGSAHDRIDIDAECHALVSNEPSALPLSCAIFCALAASPLMKNSAGQNRATPTPVATASLVAFWPWAPLATVARARCLPIVSRSQRRSGEDRGAHQMPEPMSAHCALAPLPEIQTGS